MTICFICLLIYSNRIDSERAKELQTIRQEYVDNENEKKEAKKQEELAREQLKEQDSFYQLLADGFDVNILVVGDSIAEGAGASDAEHNWANLLSIELSEKYNIKTSLTNVSMGGNTSYAGYVRAMNLDDSIDYNLVILCYGQNDNEKLFDLYYEGMLRSVKTKYPKASVISVLESSQRDYTYKMNMIQSIAKHYDIPVADTISAFSSDYDNLSTDGVHPNDEGHKVYSDTIMNVISPLTEDRRGFDPEVETINKQLSVFDNYKWYSVDDFVRDGNTFTLETQSTGTILGIDYSFVSGENSCKILIDGVEYAAPTVSFNYDFSQRHIMTVNDWANGDTVNIQNEIKVVFDETETGNEQAEKFNGLIISG